MMAVAFVMHQNRHTTHKVGMEILDLKVIDQNSFIKNHNFEAEYGIGSSVKVVDLIALNKIASGNPILSNYIKRVVNRCVNIALICMEVQYILSLL